MEGFKKAITVNKKGMSACLFVIYVYKCNITDTCGKAGVLDRYFAMIL